MNIEVMKQALETLEDIFGKNKVDVGAITALRQAIEQAEKQQTAVWVGLTKEEAADCWSTEAVRTWHAIEDKLKEKNG